DRSVPAGDDGRPGELGSVRSQPSVTAADLTPDATPMVTDPVVVDEATERRADRWNDSSSALDGSDEADRLDPVEALAHDQVAAPRDDRLPRWVLVVGVVGLFLAIIVGGATFWYNRQVNPPGPLGDEVEVEIGRGTSASGLGPRLADHGIIRNGYLFNFWAGRNDVDVHGPGRYVFNENMSYQQAKDVLETEPAGAFES